MATIVICKVKRGNFTWNISIFQRNFHRFSDTVHKFLHCKLFEATCFSWNFLDNFLLVNDISPTYLIIIRSINVNQRNWNLKNIYSDFSENTRRFTISNINHQKIQIISDVLQKCKNAVLQKPPLIKKKENTLLFFSLDQLVAKL